jgi:2-dehydropantoate 2-reductase
MRITIIGAGGVGGYFGARLAQGGCDVGFVARGAVTELGNAVNVPAPMNRSVRDILALYAQGKQIVT